jgi:hypothetical protein
VCISASAPFCSVLPLSSAIFISMIKVLDQDQPLDF